MSGQDDVPNCSGQTAEQVSGLEIARITESSVATSIQLGKLISQLSTSAPRFSTDELDQIVRSSSTELYAAWRHDEIVGMLTLVIFRIPTGMRAFIEDVIVDSHHRKQGIAEALTRAAVARAASHGCRTVDLTSRPSREEANRLYTRLGFEKRDSNVYRFVCR